MGINYQIMVLNEDFLHYLWRFRLLEMPLFTLAGDPVTVIHPGEHNRDGGPDFLNARIQIGKTVWAGNVEIHLQSSDWYRHGHQEDPAYRNVILHVVEYFDRDIVTTGNLTVPTVEIRKNYPQSLFAKYINLQLAKRWIPCQNMLSAEIASLFSLWAPALVVDRLNAKIASHRMWLSHSENNWDELTYQVLATAIGTKINAQPFELLARSAPLKLLSKHRDQFHVLEALLFGQAGLLDPSFSGEYPKELLRTFSFYQDKYSMVPLEKGTWKFLRLRPANFPTIRISQLADIIFQNCCFEGMLLETKNRLPDWIKLLSAKADPYWDSHYIFDRESGYQVKRLGINSIYLILINAIVPLLFLYGTEKKILKFSERALSLLEEIPGESNAMTSTWAELGIPANNSLLTQALIHLKTSYCDKRRCLECRIGTRLLR